MSSTALYPAVPKPAVSQQPSRNDDVLLVSGQDIEVYEVKGTSRKLLDRGTLQVSKHKASVFAKPKLRLQVGATEWEAFTEVHVLCSISTSNEPTFVFSHPDDPTTFHCLIYPADAFKQEVELLEQLLVTFTTLHVSEAKKKLPGPQLPFQLPNFQLPVITPQQVQEGLERQRKAAEAAARAIIGAAQTVGQALSQSAESAKKSLPAAQQPTPVDPALKDGLVKVKQATAAGATLAGGVATGVTAAAQQIGGSIADAVASTAGGKPPAPTNAQVKAAGEVGAAGVKAVVEIRTALEQAAYIMWFHARSSTIDLVNHSHGKDAADATAAGLDIVQGVGDMAHAAKQASMDRIMVAAVKEGAEHLRNPQSKATQQPRYPAGFNPAFMGGRPA